MIYDNLKKNENNIVKIQNKVTLNFVRGPFVEITGGKKADYKVDFVDNKTGKILFSSNIGSNCWTKCNIEYFVEWKINIYEDGNLWYEHLYNAKGKRVYISLDSKALGDTLAWFPYMEEFRKKHECEVITSTFMNDMFVDQYPNLEFVKPGINVNNLYAMYSIGLFYNDDDSINLLKNPRGVLIGWVHYLAFDLMVYNGKDVRGNNGYFLKKRLEILNDIVSSVSCNERYIIEMKKYIYKNVAHICSFKTNMARQNVIKRTK